MTPFARKLALPLIAAVALVGCDDAVGTTGGLTPEEVAALADTVVVTTFTATSEVAVADASTADLGGTGLAAATSSTTEFVTTRDCPLGGQLLLEGIRERTWDREARTGSMDLQVTKTHQACVRPFDEGDITITLNGADNIQVAAHHEFAAGQRSGLQSMTMIGAVDWVTSDDREGTCEIDVVASFDPETRTRTVTGTVCGQEIDHTREWQHSGMGGGGMGGGGMGGGGFAG